MFGFVFVGDGPAGAFGGGAEAFVEVALVDFDDGAIHFERKFGAKGFELVEGVKELLRVGLFPALRGGAQAEVFELVEECFVGVELDAFALTGTVEEGVEGALGDFGGVEQFEGAGAGIAGVGEGFESGFLALLVEGLEAVAVEVDFASDFEYGGGCVGLKAEGDGADGADVGGDVVSSGAVAAGKGVDELTVFVAEGDGDAVNFGLDDIIDGGLGEELAGALVKVEELLFGVGVGEAAHGEGVGNGVEVAERLAADALGGGAGIGPLGVGVFEGLEFGEERVVFAVGNLGPSFDVVEMVVTFEGTAEVVDSLFLIHGCILG